ncbi:hypothetical protein DFP73DRAFT_275385 [Morchella snyderi]|nr:hypothetical protein DFP73DRAFT_275385 [Morchella snyderi]
MCVSESAWCVCVCVCVCVKVCVCRPGVHVYIGWGGRLLSLSCLLSTTLLWRGHGGARVARDGWSGVGLELTLALHNLPSSLAG